jgi:hypothetical protein
MPSVAVDEDLATSILGIAKVFAGRREIGEREIELWIEYVEKGSRAHSENLREYFRAMSREGLAPTTFEAIDRFLGIEESKPD